MNWYKESQIPSYETAIVVLAKDIAEKDPDELGDDYYKLVNPLISTLISNIKKIQDVSNGEIYSQGCDKKIIVEARRLLGGLVSSQTHTVYNKLVVLNEMVRNCS